MIKIWNWLWKDTTTSNANYYLLEAFFWVTVIHDLTEYLNK